MKSKIFRNHPAPSKSFSEDMDIIAKLKITEPILEVLPKSLSQYLLATDSKGESDALEDLRKIWSLTPEEMGAVIGVGGFFLQRMEKEDSIDDIMADLETLAVIESDELPKVRPFVEALLERYKSTFNDEILANDTQKAGINILKGITHIVDLRPVVSNRLELGADVSKYKPSVSTLVPVAILRLRLSGDDEFVFQMNCKTLRTLRDELKALDMELKETIAFVGSEKITLL